MNTYAFNVAPMAGYETQFGASSAAIVITATGNGTKAQIGAAVAPITISAAGNGVPFSAARVKFGQASSAIILSAKHGIPASHPVPITYYRAPLIRLVESIADPRVIKVPAVEAGPPRIIKCDADLRVIRVPADQQGGQA